MSEEQSQIKVIDRRRSATERSASATDASTTQESPEKQASSAQTSAPESPSSDAAKTEETQQADTHASHGEVDFTSFIMSLCTQAIIMLGEVPNPETGIVSVNLEAAKQTIDILRLLSEKTKGNLSADEERLMTELVSSLQMAYVNKIKS